MYALSFLALVAGVATVSAHGVILAAQGDDGSVASQGFLVNATVARNCTTISPCQQDSTIIRDEEIKQNIVNGCGRTELNGNIDIGEQTENELAANRVTSVKKGSTLAVTIHQVNADGAGPYECDMDATSNAGINFQNLSVTNNVPGTNGLSSAKTKDFTINVQLPNDLDCTGASTGNICTVRCRNTALAGPFGGCFAVQQTDGGGRANNKTASQISTAASLDEISKQIQVNQADFAIAVAANQAAGADGQNAGVAAVASLASSSAAVASATASSTSSNSNSNSKSTHHHHHNNNNKRQKRHAFHFAS